MSSHQPPVPLQICRWCSAIALPSLSWQRFRNGKYHVRAECGCCGLFLRHVAATPTIVSILGDPPRSPSSAGEASPDSPSSSSSSSFTI